MKRSTESHFVTGVILILVALLALPVLLLLVAFNQDKLCMLGNLIQDDPAGRAATQIKAPGPGILDFRPLAGEYDRICLVDIDSEVSIEGVDVEMYRRAGRDLCGGFKPNAPVFALMSGRIYTPLRHRFESLPPTPHPIPTRATSCARTSEAVVHCFSWGYDGEFCVFSPTE